MAPEKQFTTSRVGVLLLWLAVFGLLGLLLALPASATPTGQSSQAFHATGRLAEPVVLEHPLPITEAVRPPQGVEAWTVLLDENFNSAWPAGAWQTWDDNGATGGQYTWANRCPSTDGTTSAWSLGGGANGGALACGAPYPYNVNSWAWYGPLDLSNATAGQLTYSFCIASRCNTDNSCSGGADPLKVMFSTDGTNFNGMWHAGYLDNYAPWCTGYQIDLSDVNTQGLSMLGQPQVWVAFVFQSGSGYTQNSHLDGAYIDNVRLTVDTASCAATASITTLATDKSCYVPGATIGAFVNVTTTQAPQSVRAVASLWSGDIIWGSGESTFTAPGSQVISVPISSQPAPFPGDYDLVVTLYDAQGGCQQDQKTVKVRVDPVCGSVTAPVSPTATRTPTRTPTFTRTPTRTPTRTATPTPTGTVWAPVCPNGRWSHNVAIVPDPVNGGGTIPTTGARFADVTFTNLAPGDISAGRLAAFDTLVFNMFCDANTVLTAQQKSAINAWVGAGHKFIIYDSDVCAGSRQPDYSWLMYPFSSSNPGAIGTHGGELTIVEDNTLSSPDAGSPYYIDTANITADTDAVGDSNVMLARSQGWCGDMHARNTLNAEGWTHTYGPYGSGLVIYNGLDTDDISDNQWLEKIWQFELCQPPQGLPCSVNVLPITATPTVTVTRFPTVTPTPSRTVTRTPTRTPTRTVTPTRTPTLTPTPTPTMTCVPPRPPVTPECSPAQAPNAIRNQHFTLGPRSWGEFSGQGRELVNTADHRAEFYGPPGVANHELLYQLVSIPPDAQSVSFWVGDYSTFAAAWGMGDPPPPPPPGLNTLRVSLYDATLTAELARLWQIDLATAPNCEPDPSSYNLTPGELALVRGQTVALVFEFQKVTTEHNWTAGAKVDDIHLHICSPSPPCRVNRDKTASPSSVAPGGEVTVLLSLQGLDGACLPSRQPSDVVLVLDRSGSMAGQPLQDAKTAAKGFVDRLDLSADQVGVVSFGNTARLDQTLTQMAGPPRTAIDALVADGVTNMADALRTAQAELTSARHLPANRPVLILLSDGRPNPAADERAVAASARAAGTRLFTIGLGSQADAALMTELASSPSDYFYAPDSTQLDRIYQQIAGAIGGDPATNIVIEDRLSPYVTLVPNSFTGSPTPSVSADGKTLTWRIPRLGLETQRWSYRVKMTQTPGTWPTNSYATATYTDSRGQPGALVFPIPQVTVLAPAAKNQQIMCKDYAADTGRVPSNPNGEAWWDSPDIWVRNQPDSVEGHQNPLVGQQNYVTVRVRNIGDTAVNDIKVHVYAAPGAASIRWPDEWVPEIGSDTLPTLAAGATGTVKVAWTPSKEGHTCFLTRIEAPVDPITADGWVPFDNNICQKNVQVIDAGPTTSGVTVGNAHHGSGYGSLTVNSPPVAAGASARVTFTDAAMFNRWQGAGGTVSGGQVIPGTTSIRLDLQPPAALVESGQEVHELTSDTVFSAQLDRIPLAGDETTQLTFEVETPPNAEPPTLQITEWMDGQAVGGNVLRRAMVVGGQLFLPQILKGHAP